MAKKNNLSTTVLNGVELVTFNNKRWSLKRLNDRKHFGVFGTYTLEEWESIFNHIQKQNPSKKRVII